MSEPKRFQADDLRRWGAAILSRLGVPAADARTTAVVLVESNLNGFGQIPTHLPIVRVRDPRAHDKIDAVVGQLANSDNRFRITQNSPIVVDQIA